MAICALGLTATVAEAAGVVITRRSRRPGSEIRVVSRRRAGSTQPGRGRFRGAYGGPAAGAPFAEGWFNPEVEKEKAAYLGVAVSPLSEALGKQLSLPRGVGLLVDFLDPDGPAKAAGLKKHDVLHKLNDQILINFHQLAVLVRTFKPGTEVGLTVIRKAKPVIVKVKLAEKELAKLPPAPARSGGPRSAVTQLWPEKIRKMFEQAPLRWRPVPEFTMTVPVRGYMVTIKGPSRARKVAVRDRRGKVIYEGPIDSDEARAKIPKEVLADLARSGWVWLMRSCPPEWILRSHSDGRHTLTVSTRKGQRYLVVEDRSGKVVFEGPIRTPAQRKAVPGEILKKLEKTESLFERELKRRPPFVPEVGPPVPPRRPARPGQAI